MVPSIIFFNGLETWNRGRVIAMPGMKRTKP